MNAMTSLETRALSLLGAGNPPVQVALALGVTESRISQLLSDEEFARKVTEAKFQTLARHNERDNKYDSLEDALTAKLEDSLPLMIRPMEILRGLQLVNSLKRRGQSAPESLVNHQQVVQVVMPVQLVNKFTVSGSNQVVEAGEQTLVTMQSHNLNKMATDRKVVSNGSGEQKRITVGKRITAGTVSNL
jgi:hypothetical protein